MSEGGFRPVSEGGFRPVSEGGSRPVWSGSHVEKLLPLSREHINKKRRKSEEVMSLLGLYSVKRDLISVNSGRIDVPVAPVAPSHAFLHAGGHWVCSQKWRYLGIRMLCDLCVVRLV